MAIIVGVAAVSAARGAEGAEDRPSADRDLFVGAWRLVWLEELGPDGNVHEADCTGMFVFTRDGHESPALDVAQALGGCVG